MNEHEAREFVRNLLERWIDCVIADRGQNGTRRDVSN